jgi:hypothetical protein
MSKDKIKKKNKLQEKKYQPALAFLTHDPEKHHT